MMNSGIHIGWPHIVKYTPKEISPEWHWIMGKVVTVTGDKYCGKYPVQYDHFPNDGFNRRVQRIRGDLLEPLVFTK